MFRVWGTWQEPHLGPAALSPAGRWVDGARGQRQQLPFLALDTKSIRAGWEKASADLLIQPQQRTSPRINAIRRQKGSAGRGEGQG